MASGTRDPVPHEPIQETSLGIMCVNMRVLVRDGLDNICVNH